MLLGKISGLEVLNFNLMQQGTVSIMTLLLRVLQRNGTSSGDRYVHLETGCRGHGG